MGLAVGENSNAQGLRESTQGKNTLGRGYPSPEGERAWLQLWLTGKVSGLPPTSAGLQGAQALQRALRPSETDGQEAFHQSVSRSSVCIHQSSPKKQNRWNMCVEERKTHNDKLGHWTMEVSTSTICSVCQQAGGPAEPTLWLPS